MLLAVHYRVMEHLGSLESTQEARAALGYASGNSYASFMLSKLPACSITRWCTLKHEPIVNSYLCNSLALLGLHCCCKKAESHSYISIHNHLACFCSLNFYRSYGIYLDPHRNRWCLKRKEKKRKEKRAEQVNGSQLDLYTKISKPF